MKPIFSKIDSLMKKSHDKKKKKSFDLSNLSNALDASQLDINGLNDKIVRSLPNIFINRSNDASASTSQDRVKASHHHQSSSKGCYDFSSLSESLNNIEKAADYQLKVRPRTMKSSRNLVRFSLPRQPSFHITNMVFECRLYRHMKNNINANASPNATFLTLPLSIPSSPPVYPNLFNNVNIVHHRLRRHKSI
ncbi:uncharacterized protein G2W53_016510 [Senna tora]|uniref:Uncharacterized protein n=1 Tax=Senna tora TaxID=362788 RepID=A0A834TQZ9_9FABA|nr:uncharacterized protein G2W53_016510 [Senna tora]